MVGGGVGEALAVGVELGGVVELAEGVDSAVGVEGGELVGLALPDGGVGVTEGEGVRTGVVADAVGLAVSDNVGIGLPAEVGASDGAGVGLSAGVEVSAGAGVPLTAGEVSDGSGVEATVDVGVATLGEIVGVSSGPSAEEARGKKRINDSPASDRALAGLNKETFTPSS